MDILVDADIMIFQFACVNEVEYVWDEETASQVSDPEAAKHGIDEFITNLLIETEADKAKFCFTTSPNFRYDVLPTYKHNRQGQPRPEMLEELRAYIHEKYEVKTKPSLEADDVMGILATITPGKYIIASIDKDLKQIPGLHYNWRTGKLFEITPEEAEYCFYRQVLMGDPTDGYRGCPGIGPKRSEKILKGLSPEEYWPAVVKTYESKGLTAEDALVQARVARILQKDDWDFENNCYILWEPPKGLQ